MNYLNKKKLFENKNNSKKNKDLKNKKKININSNSINNNVKLVIKKRVINFKNNNNSTNNYETSEFNNTRKHNNLSRNIIRKIGTHSFKIFWNNKDYEKNAIIRKIKKINNNKENKHMKSQDNLLTFHKSKKSTRNLSYFSLYKKKSLPTSKGNISAKIKKNTYVQNNILNIFRNYIIKDSNKKLYYSKDKIKNVKKISFKPIRISKSNINIINLGITNQNESLLNKITKKVYKIIQKKGKRNEKLNLKKTGDDFRKNRMYSTYYNSAKRTPNSLTVYYKNINTNKENNFLTNNHYRNNNKFIFKSTLNSKNNKSIKSPSLLEFTKFINAKNLQKNYQTLEGKSNNIQNLNININNQINIRLNSNINEMPNFSINNNKNKIKFRTKNKNKNKSIDYNTNLNYRIKYKTNFSNNNLIDFNMKNKENRNKKKFIVHLI